MADELHKFLFDGLPVRGLLVRLGPSWHDLLARRPGAAAYPPAVRNLLGEMAAASVLMQALIKFNGALILQVQGDGPVRLAVAEAQPDLSFRATATLANGAATAQAIGQGPVSLQALVNVRGQGRCAITLDPKDRLPGQQPYQGVVPLHGDQREPLQRLSQVLEHYMLQSEQLDTRLVLAANDEMAAGLLIQRMPVQGQGNLRQRNEDEIGHNEDFNRIAHLAATLTAEELLGLDADTVLRRLFWEEAHTRYEPVQPRFACSCSRERVSRMLQGLGQEESVSLIEERGQVEVGCEFCGQQYRFDAVDVGEMFTPPVAQGGGSSAVN